MAFLWQELLGSWNEKGYFSGLWAWEISFFVILRISKLHCRFHALSARSRVFYYLKIDTTEKGGFYADGGCFEVI